MVLAGFMALFSTSSLVAQSGCPGCVVSLPPLPEDTIYLGAAPDGVAGQYYDGDLHFRMPKTTTPVNAMDPSTPPGLNISKVNIVALFNVPPGLSWEPNKFSFNTQSETDGCVKFCGTPLLPGLYEVQVFVTAEVSLITQSTTFSFPIYIAPAVSNNDGFSMENNSGCGKVTVQFENNIPANGQSGYSYLWDFGNGQTSTSENPGEQTYSAPGVYDVSFQATIDTFGYQLTTVRVLNSPCTDIGLPPIFSPNPDLYLRIKDQDNNLLLQTSVLSNTSYPAIFNVNLMLPNGTFGIEVRDEDTFGDESCGFVYFTKYTAGTLVSGELEVAVDIIHPVSVVESSGQVTVYPIPEPPVVEPEGVVGICAGSKVELETVNYFENLQWYQDTSLLFGEISSTLLVSEAGNYRVQYSSAVGCKSQSEPVSVNVLQLPQTPAFQAIGNQLTLLSSVILPGDYSLQWFQDGEPIPEATTETYCITEPGVYLFSLEVTDNATGCANSFNLGAAYNPNYLCALSDADQAATIDATLKIYPNPTSGFIWISFKNAPHSTLNLLLYDALGQLVWQANERLDAEFFHQELDLSAVPAGLYFLKISAGDQHIIKRVVRN